MSLHKVGSQTERTRRPPALPLAALVVALGVLFPILFHGVGLGPVFLPMFIPLSIGAFFLSPSLAGTAGLLTPLISSFATGMPPWMPPVAPVLALELLIFGILLSLLNRKGLRPLVALFLALLADRVLVLIIVSLIAPLFGWPQAVFGFGAVISGLPGILLMLVFVPPILRKLGRYLPEE